MLDGCVPWPSEVGERYRRLGLWAGVGLGELPDCWAERWGKRDAIVAPTGRVSYEELAERSAALARSLVELGVRPGDRVVVHLGSDEIFVVLCFALFRMGALPVFALPAHRGHEIGYLVEHSKAVAYAVPGDHEGFDYVELGQAVAGANPGLRHMLISGERERDEATRLDLLIERGRESSAPLSSPDPADVALFLLSGGTTGLPKLIPRTHDDYLYNARESATLCGVGADSAYLVALPISHNFPFGCPGLLGTLAVGGKVILARSPDPATAFALIEAERVTHTALVPALALRWMESEQRERFDLSSLELLQVGGAKLNPAAARRVEPALGVRLQQVFGMAEGLLNYTRPDDHLEVIEETQGRPLSDEDEIRIVDGDGIDVVPGERGELLTRGPYTIRGYYRANDHNQRAFTADGFYRTGDVVRLDDGGNLIVEGREKDLINRGGEKISAEEIEDLILAHPSVFNVAAVAMPDAALGERTCVFVVPHGDDALELDALKTFLHSRKVAKFKWPERLELVESLPLTNIGKVSKQRLRDEIAAKLAAEEPTARAETS